MAKVNMMQMEERVQLADAAPVMLDALKAAAEFIHDEIRNFGARSDFKDTDTLKVIAAAIAKAEGRT